LANLHGYAHRQNNTPQVSTMNSTAHLHLLAEYNQWMNQRLYACAAQLSDEVIRADKGTFFSSILGTLNHIAVGDTIWLKRIASHPACAILLTALDDVAPPASLNTLLYPNLSELRAYRQWLDELIIHLVDNLAPQALADDLTYANMKGVRSTRNMYALLTHFFNHQTHHRGQVTTLLFQLGIDPGSTDLLNLIPDKMER
jgi:uncharacterized damage-inducible protein DinB